MPSPTSRLLALTLDPDVQTADDAMSGRILDAALALAADSGLRQLTMDGVAARAGVGRMTVYRRFGGKPQLLDALAVRECRRCLASLAGAIDPSDPIDERTTSLFLAVLRVIREHPLLARLARVEPESLLSELTRDDNAVFRLVCDFLIAQIRTAQASGELLETEPAALAEIALRLGVSFVLMPDSVIALEDDQATREVVRSLVAPLLAR
jgi:AcrR family transcriptional regulator